MFYRTYINQLNIILWKNKKILFKKRLKFITICIEIIISLFYVNSLGITLFIYLNYLNLLSYI